jgi:cyanophycinase
MTASFRTLAAALILAPLTLVAQTKVGPPNGTVIVVGGGGQGPEIFARLIAAAGGPDALILDVPTAGGDSVYPADWRGQNGLRTAGAKNVKVLHTRDRKLADSDEWLAQFKDAKGVWFEGGRHYHLVDAYAGTKTEKLFHDILARGGVVAGSSAGASILGSYLVRGAPSNNNLIMSYTGAASASTSTSSRASALLILPIR